MVKSKRLDITAVENSIGGRQGWAYICNSCKFAVLRVDFDKEQEYETYKTYGDVRVKTQTKSHGELHTKARLVSDEGTYKLTSWGCGISSSFGYYDAMELIDSANSPMLKADDVVALAKYKKEKKTVFLSLYRVGRVDIHCQTVAILEPLTEEEMKDIVRDAEMWCMR